MGPQGSENQEFLPGCSRESKFWVFLTRFPLHGWEPYPRIGAHPGLDILSQGESEQTFLSSLDHADALIPSVLGSTRSCRGVQDLEPRGKPSSYVPSYTSCPPTGSISTMTIPKCCHGEGVLIANDVTDHLKFSALFITRRKGIGADNRLGFRYYHGDRWLLLSPATVLDIVTVTPSCC